MVWRRAVRVVHALFPGLVVLAPSCATPTSVDVDVYSEVPCDKNAAAVVVMAAALPDLGASAPNASSTKCDPGGYLGKVVVTPAGAKDSALAVAVMTRPDGQSAERCLERGAKGCIVSKRRFRFEKHVEASMRIDLRLSCVDVQCKEDETCVRGRCVPVDIDCGPSCDEQTLLDKAGITLDGGSSTSVTPVPLASGPYAKTPHAIAVGVDHACVLLENGQVGCFGANDVGQLGDGTFTASATPNVVAGLPAATAVAAGNKFSCALVDGGRVMCWGANARGQLGDGSIDLSSPTPRAVRDVANATSLALGDHHACIASANEVRCWGGGDKGQLGSGATDDARTPMLVSLGFSLNGSVPVYVGAGAGHSCVANLGTFSCWGDNASGQLGDGTQNSRSKADQGIAIPNGSVQDLFLGGASSCYIALIAGGNGIACWGANDFGQLGDGSNAPQSSPKSLGLISGGSFGNDGGVGFTTYRPVHGAMGDAHACQLSTPGQVLCWGHNDVGQLGDGIAGDENRQTIVPALTAVTAVAAGGSSTCAIGDFGLRCFGRMRK